MKTTGSCVPAASADAVTTRVRAGEASSLLYTCSLIRTTSRCRLRYHHHITSVRGRGAEEACRPASSGELSQLNSRELGMGLRPDHCLAFLLVLLLVYHGRGISEQRAEDAPERDVTTPLATVPVVNPTVTTPTAMPTATPATRTPSLANPVAGGGSWCVASPGASGTALQVALNYACGQGGADCSAIQPGGSCFNPDTVRDHASYAFNSYYQKNPVQTSCDFGGTAVLTSTNPSTSTCQYPGTSTGASVLNTATPLTPTTYGSPGYDNNSPPAGYGNSPPLYGSMSPPDYGGNISAAADALPGKTAALSLTTCLLIATISLAS